MITRDAKVYFRTILLLALLIPLHSYAGPVINCVGRPKGWERVGKVIDVLSGEQLKVDHGEVTFTCRHDYGEPAPGFTVKRVLTQSLYGVDAPENDQPFGKEARKYLEKLTLGKEVTMEGGKVRAGKIADLSLELLSKGYVWWNEDHTASYSDKLKTIERKVRNKKVGLWANPNPISPYEWRRRKMSLSATLEIKIEKKQVFAFVTIQNQTEKSVFADQRATLQVLNNGQLYAPLIRVKERKSVYRAPRHKPDPFRRGKSLKELELVELKKGEKLTAKVNLSLTYAMERRKVYRAWYGAEPAAWTSKEKHRIPPRQGAERDRFDVRSNRILFSLDRGVLGRYD